MVQIVTIGTQPFLLDFVVIPMKRNGYDAILGRGWLVQAKAKHDWKRNTLSMERGGRRFTIDLHTQMVGEEAASSDSEGEGAEEEKGQIEPDGEGVLRLEGGSSDDDLDSVNGLFHWQMEDYELFPSCNILGVDEGEKEEGNECPKDYREVEEGKVVTAEAEGKSIPNEPRKRKNSTVRYIVNGPRGKKRLHRTMNLVERCRQQGKHIVQAAQETKRKGLIKTSAVRSEGSKIKNTATDRKEWQPTEFMVSSFENKLGDMESLREGWYNLNKLDKRRVQAQWATKVLQCRRKAWHDRHLRRSRFQPRQLVLKYNGRNEIKPSKFKVKWVGPFKIWEVGCNGAIKLWTLDGKEVPDPVNGSKLKIYHENNRGAPRNNPERK